MAEKRRAVAEVVAERNASWSLSISTNIVDAKRELANCRYDLLLLDINLPKSEDRAPEMAGGLEIVRWLRGRGLPHRPAYIIALTAFEEALAIAEAELGNLLWKTLRIDLNKSRWKAELAQTLVDLEEQSRAPFRGDGRTNHIDVLVVTALESPELAAVLALPAAFEPIAVEHDASRYYRGRLARDRVTVDIIAVAASDKGMAATAIAASKGIQAFWPKYVYMPGITAGLKGRTGIGDVIFAELTWDWGSGKMKVVDGVEEFHPAPYQRRLDETLLQAARALVTDSKFLADQWANSAFRSLAPIPKIRCGVMASGSSVLQSSPAVARVLHQHKDLLAIEMEAFSLMFACQAAPQPRPQAIVAKAVCDAGDEEKNDEYQTAAAFTSAITFAEFAIRFLSSDPSN